MPDTSSRIAIVDATNPLGHRAMLSTCPAFALLRR